VPDEVLSRAWVEQLYREYENILYQYNVPLRCPLIRVLPLKGVWASWDPHARVIAIHAKLIKEYGWDITLEVLKHEMAHQLVTDLFGGKGGPHGRPFQLACDKLGVLDWARTASGALPEHIPTPKERLMSDEEEKMLKRVEKLLSLATSSNEHEALLAMQRVQEIYARYNLERLRDHKESTWIRLVIPLHKKRIERHISMICGILIGHFFVRVVTRQLYDAALLESYCAVELLGTKENVLMAEYVYHFLLNQTESLYQQRKTMLSAGRKTRSDFVLGVLDGFRRKLHEGQAELMKNAAAAMESKQSTALVRQGEHQLEEFVEQCHPRLKSRKANYTYTDREAFAAGQEDGRRLVLHKGISEDEPGRGRLLGSGKG